VTAAEDRAKRRAVDSLARRLRERDAAVATGADAADCEPFAAEYVTAMWGQGWRPVEVLRPHDWRPGGESGTGEGKEAFGRELAAIKARNEARQEAGTATQEGT
jgi:hypothetical protein